MGQFSWYTNDGVRILDNRQLKRPVYMVGKMPDSRILTFTEEYEYEGYGVFGGKDYFVFMAEMNGFTADDFGGNIDKLRSKGISLAFEGDPHGENAQHLYPSLSLDGRWYGGVSPKSDPDQGWGVTRKDVEDGLYDLDISDVEGFWDDDEDLEDDVDDIFFNREKLV